MQGFPEEWQIYGAVYMALGQIGNAVPPPMAYRVAESLGRGLSGGKSQSNLLPK